MRSQEEPNAAFSFGAAQASDEADVRPSPHRRIPLAPLFFVVQRQALGLAVRLTLGGNNQFGYASTWAYLIAVLVCILTQMNYLNKVSWRAAPRTSPARAPSLPSYKTGPFPSPETRLWTRSTRPWSHPSTTCCSPRALFWRQLSSSKAGVTRTNASRERPAWNVGVEVACLTFCLVRLPFSPPSLGLHCSSPCARCLTSPSHATDAYTGGALITCVCGFLTICAGVFMLHESREKSQRLLHGADSEGDSSLAVRTRLP
jgi:hypothetical protein